MINKIYSSASLISRLYSGPLGEHIDGFAISLYNNGYSIHVLREKFQIVVRLGSWLSQQQIEIAAFDEQCIIEFLDHCSRRRQLGTVTATLDQLLAYLRKKGVLPAAVHADVDTRQPIERKFSDYLALERGLSEPAIKYQLLIARRFLAERFGNSRFDCSRLCAADVTQFTLRHVNTYKLRSAQTMLSALRGFLRFLYIEGETQTDLTGCIFKVANWRLASLPTFLETSQVERLLKSVDQTARSGLRDYAILLLLARLGLRGGEVIKLELEDIDWEVGTITVRGKGGCHNRLPIPQDVGKAIVKYLRHGRPKCSCRRVFLRAIAPYGMLRSSSSTHDIAKKHLLRAGLQVNKWGAHILRHSLATRMIRGGNTLDEIGNILGHHFHSSTEIYTKVAITTLRALAQPWPGVKL